MTPPHPLRVPQTLFDKPAPMQKRLAIVLTCALLLAGCSGLRFPGVYRIDIEQGNIVTDDMLAKLKPGMNEAQVRYVMGSPQITDPFEPGRWVYAYRLRRGDRMGEVVEGKVVLTFENGALARWEGNTVPPAARNRVNTSGTPAASAPSQGEGGGESEP